MHYFGSMGEEKPDTLDFVKDFQEYLSQQTQHVNMISGSVSGVKEADELPPGNGYYSKLVAYTMQVNITRNSGIKRSVHWNRHLCVLPPI